MSAARLTCRTCCFREPDNRAEYEGAGHCRRFPPTVSEQVTFDGSGANHFSQLWPWMHATDWCGEYSPEAAS
jgi:hypothetical protein